MTNLSLPQFTNVDIPHFAERLDALLTTHLAQINTLLKAHDAFTWDNLMQPLETMEDQLERLWSPFAHLHAVVNSPALRNCYQACLPKLSAYETALGQNQALYDAVKSLDKRQLNATQCKIVDDALRDFRLSGVALSAAKKRRFEIVSARLSELSNQYENHILDAAQDYQLHITDAKRLTGLPEHTIANAQALAQEKGLPGWILNLEFPCYLAVVTYADDRAIREALHQAYVTRASDQGPSAGKFDNSALMNEILALRHESAQLLGFANYAELSIATKMAESTHQVNQFLHDLRTRAHAQAAAEFKALQAFAQTHSQLTELAPWDLAYFAEKKRHACYAISQEELRPYFPLHQVMQGLLTILQRLYGMTLEEVTPTNAVDVWHPDVRCYRVLDEHQIVRGYVYLDLFARPNKRGGAWMDSLQSRLRRADGSLQLPIATLTCNFAKPAGDKPPTLSHEELETLFHELGHCLQHLLTQVDYLSASGIHGVEWDAVELPSQFFENWCWDASTIQLLTAHVDTGQTLPSALFDKLHAAKNFQSALAMLRQLEFSLFDFRMHQEYKPGNETYIADMLADVRKQTAVTPIAPYNRFQNSFAHIFSGGYSAGYYSYKWAEVLSSDAFARFEDEGIFNAATGRDFLHCILEVGGACKASQAFEKFRGRPAQVDALLKHNGING